MTTATTAPPAPPMANTPEPAPPGPDPAVQDPGRRRRDGALTNTILSVLGAAFVAVLAVTLTTTNARITRVENKVDTGFERVDNKIDTKFTELDNKIAELDDKFDTKFAELDDKIDNIDLKLTALIAGLNQTAEVEAALDGSILEPDTS